MAERGQVDASPGNAASCGKGPLIVLSGPSGSGKSTIIRRLLLQQHWPLRLSVSVTTRQRRPGEQEGIDYHYWDREQFQAELARDGFLEWAEVYGNYYGTLRSEVEPFRERGVGVLLDIDVQGWQQVRKRCGDLVSVFLRTESLKTYEDRLRKRATETEESIQRRIEGAARELALAGNYDYQVINEDLELALSAMGAILKNAFERVTHAG